MEPLSIALTLAQFAPALLRWLGVGGAPVAVAERAAEIAKTVTGEPTTEGALAALQADRALQVEFQKAVLANATELERLYLADRQDARARDVALAQAGRRNVRADVMVAVDAIGLIACLVVLAVYREKLAGEVIALISTIASIFGLCLRDAHQFEFGSSRGSEQKQEQLASMLKQKTTP